MNNQKCRRCGSLIQRFRSNYQYLNGDIYERTGERSGSAWMAKFDQTGYFCTMRCAAMQAIESAKRGEL